MISEEMVRDIEKRLDDPAAPPVSAEEIRSLIRAVRIERERFRLLKPQAESDHGELRYANRRYEAALATLHQTVCGCRNSNAAYDADRCFVYVVLDRGLQVIGLSNEGRV